MGGLFSGGAICIHIEGGSQVLQPGQFVKGEIRIHTEGDFEASKFTFALVGMEHLETQIKTTHRNGNNSSTTYSEVTEDKRIFEQEVFEIQCGGFAPKGDFTYPFSFQVP